MNRKKWPYIIQGIIGVLILVLGISKDFIKTGDNKLYVGAGIILILLSIYFYFRQNK